MLRSISKITFHSSPLQKLLILDKVFTMLTRNMPDQEADAIFKVVFYSLIKLGPKDGANLFIELKYINKYCPESIKDINEGFQKATHLETAINYLLKGFSTFV